VWQVLLIVAALFGLAVTLFMWRAIDPYRAKAEPLDALGRWRIGLKDPTHQAYRAGAAASISDMFRNLQVSRPVSVLGKAGDG